MHTIEEAKKLICPQKVAYIDKTPSGYINTYSTCCADECMWWVWDDSDEVLTFTKPEDMTGWEEKGGTLVATYWVKKVPDKRGRCGRVKT